MAKVITFSIQKGGCGKSTTTGVVAHLLSKKYRVLAIDLDSQGNLTELLTQRDIYDFHGETVLEAIKEQNAVPYIHSISKDLDMMTAEDHLATLPRWLYTEYRGNKALALKNTLETVKDTYDYILIDTPPALGDQTVNALCASDYVVALCEPSQFAYSALGRFLETVGHAQNVNPGLQLVGILVSLLDKRRSDNRAFLELIQEEYPELVFETIISRKASTGRLSTQGFGNNPELSDAVESFKGFVEELLTRVKQGQRV